MLYLILYLSLFIGLISFFLHGLYSYYKSCKEEEKEWKDFLNSLTPGSKWKLPKEPNMNPFVKPSRDIIVIVIATCKNSYGDLWVQYKFKDTENPHEMPACNFQKLYNKLN